MGCWKRDDNKVIVFENVRYRDMKEIRRGKLKSSEYAARERESEREREVKKKRQSLH